MAKKVNPLGNLKSIGGAQLRAAKKNTGRLVHSAKEAIDQTKEAAVQAMDQTGDGKVDLDDVAAVAGVVGGAVKKGARALKEGADEQSRLRELNALQPFFADVLGKDGAEFPRIIGIAERDERYVKSPVCKGAIGYYLQAPKAKVLNLFKDTISGELSFYPALDSGIYYLHPFIPNFYIEANHYFEYIKRAHIEEMKRVAQMLGARHIVVRFKYDEKDHAQEKIKAHVKAGAVKAAGANVDAEQDTSASGSSSVRIESETRFTGQQPERPELHYLKNDPGIENLIEMRMNPESKVEQEHIVEKSSISAGMSKSDVATIDAALKGIDTKGQVSFKSQYENESRRSLEYEIEF